MPDRPDWSKYLPGSERHPLEDLGELAARLNSPVTFDRRGEVIWVDDFSTGLTRWRGAGTGGNSDVTVDADYSYWSGYSAKLYADGVVGGSAGLFRYFSPPKLGKWGFEIAIAFFSDFYWSQMSMVWDDGSDVYIGTIRLDNDSNELQYYGSDGHYHKIVDLSTLHYDYGLYHLLKVVIDFENKTYERVIFNETEYDLTAHAIETAVTGNVPLKYVNINLTSDKANPDTARLGAAIVTANEP